MKKLLLIIAAIALTINASAQRKIDRAQVTAEIESAIQAHADSCCKPYKEYVATMNQTGTNNPVVTVISNELSGAIVWTRVMPGFFTGTLAGEFTAGKVVTISNTSIAGGGAGNTVSLAQPFPITVDIVGLQTYLLKNTSDRVYTTANISDGNMSNQLIIIRVYQ